MPKEDLSQWLGERRDTAPPDGWYTRAQLSEEYGLSESTMRGRLRDLIESGEWERKLFRIEYAGRLMPTPHYRPKTKGRSSK